MGPKHCPVSRLTQFVVVKVLFYNKGIPCKLWLQNPLLDPFASIFCVIVLFVVNITFFELMNNQRHMLRVLNCSLSLHSVGLITTNCSLLQPLRMHHTLLKQNALAKNKVCFSEQSIRGGLCLILCFGATPLSLPSTHPPKGRLFSVQPVVLLPKNLLGLPSTHLRTQGPFWPVLAVGLMQSLWIIKEFQKKVYLGEKTLWISHISMYFVFIFFIWILFTFLPVEKPLGHHHGQNLDTKNTFAEFHSV